LGELEELYARYRDRVAFFVVYVREAHPEDGWVLTSNRSDGITVKDPTNDDERAVIAAACEVGLSISLPILVDSVDDEVALRYGAWPDRLYLVGRNGRIAFQGGEGPFGFKPEELGAAIVAELGQG
jgi:iodothyronine deiodinase-like protein